MMQNNLLVWLDGTIDEQNDNCQKTIGQFRHVVNTIKPFTDSGRCIHFLESMKDENAFMVVSGALGEQIVPRIHSMSQIDAIFVFCSNQSYHEKWAKNWWKVRGVFTQIQPVCEALKQAVDQFERNAVSISIMTASDALANKQLNQLDSSFMYTQIMKEILLTITFEQKHIQEFLQHSRQALSSDAKELDNINYFEKHYRDKTPVWWYTCESFLYPMLNRALRTMDADLIIKLGFFIKDLHCQIEQLHKEQYSGHKSQKSFLVYRGQGVDKEALQKMIATEGGLLSFNFFLSTSTDSRVAQDFADRVSKSADLVAVIFVMTIDPTRSTTSFASVIEHSAQKSKEQEILFSMHSIFRIGNIRSMDKNQHLFQIELTLTSDNDKDLRLLTDRIREETFPDSIGWYRLGQVLVKLGRPKQAEQVYIILLDQTNDDNVKAPIYHQLGAIKDELGEYEEALVYYNKDLQITENSLRKNDSNLVISYNNIGNVHARMGNYDEALAAYQKVLAIKEQTSSAKSLDLATCYNNIGNVHAQMNDNVNALSSHEKAHAILQELLPTNHPNLATSHFNIGLLYEQADNYSKAQKSYERAVDIGQRALPLNHPDLQDYRKKLADIKKK